MVNELHGDARQAVQAAIIGTGFAGLAMGAKLKEAGIDDFVLFEKAGEVGGTWRDNTYPGCACDVPSHLYSFSFAQNPDWSQSFSPQPEIQAYLVAATKRLGLRRHIRFGHEVLEARWDEARDLWRIQTSRGVYNARFLISGMGGLHEPSTPDIPGLDRFEGTVFHSARWNHGHDLTGERVAVIGTGASAIQFVPQIQPKVRRLHLFQRTPPWIVPRANRRITRLERWLFRRFPLLQRLARAGIYWSRESLALGMTRHRKLLKGIELIGRLQLRAQVRDPELRRKLTPHYTIGCKRILVSNDYLPSVAKPNVELVTSGIKEIGPSWILTNDGVKREVDTIIFGTGFHVTDVPAAGHLYGKGGVLLADAWANGLEAYLGTSVAGFPNLFFLTGPNTGLGHNSIVYMIEAQVAYLVDMVDRARTTGQDVLEVRPEVQASFNDDIQSRMGPTVWLSGGCASWYLDDRGRNTTLWPDFTWRFKKLTARFDPESYMIRAGRPAQDRPIAAEGAA
jgi:cation diffusion facilitator CzcD-associated flavoprotein CzcO